MTISTTDMTRLVTTWVERMVERDADTIVAITGASLDSCGHGPEYADETGECRCSDTPRLAAEAALTEHVEFALDFIYGPETAWQTIDPNEERSTLRIVLRRARIDWSERVVHTLG